MPRKTNQAGVDMIKFYEGYKAKAYKDIGGVLTIGYGHTGHDVIESQVITESMADTLLKFDMEDAEKCINEAVKTRLNDNQFSALVVLTYNIGSGSFLSSTLLKCLNRGDFKNAALEFLRWDKVNGSEIKGLLARRRAEQDLFNRPVL